MKKLLLKKTSGTFLFALLIMAAVLAQPLPAMAGVITDTPVLEEVDEDALNPNMLTLMKSSVPNGARNIPLNPLIQLDFNKNVVSYLVAKENVSSYHLVDKTGNSVPISIIVPDDQLQQAVKRTVFITPEEQLQPESIYTLAVDNTLKNKNGENIDDAHTIVFKTGTHISSEENPVLTMLNLDVLTYSGNLPLNENSVPGSSPTSSALNRPAGGHHFSLNDINTELISRIIIIVSAAILGLTAVFRVLRRRADL